MRDLGGRDAMGGGLLLLVACFLVALAAYALPRPMAADVVAAVRRTVLRPVVALQARAERDRTSRFQLEVIEAQRDSLALLVLADTGIRSENAQLRAMLAIRPRATPRWTPAEILHQPTPTDARMLLLGTGSDAGLAKFQPVITPDGGLLGYIWSVGPRSSAVLTWMHPDWRASAVTGEGSVMGILAPTLIGTSGQPLLELRGVALRDSLAIGTLVFTSGLGGVYPRMLPVGRVSGVTSDPLGYERRYVVAPFANPAIASHVLVRTEPADPAIGSVPATDSTP
jgi:rod shape-determining protein MreC